MAIPSRKAGAGKRAAELFTASGGQNDPRSNVIRRLYRGEFSLTVTFWIFFVSVPLVGHLVFSRLILPALDPRAWYGSTAFFVWPLLTLLYAFLTCVGLWRSRARFSGNPLWPNLAGLAALLGAVGAVAYAVMIAASWFLISQS
ncbi:hypothetical protein [Mailhella sp.]|uniref:hypothetical protein n=1 Tax=Mailhella sp. TaxID=1981029 RepID=UPI003AB44764